jgi:oligoribonuclease (3'-5' exoribonuclease)
MQGTFHFYYKYYAKYLKYLQKYFNEKYIDVKFIVNFGYRLLPVIYKTTID